MRILTVAAKNLRKLGLDGFSILGTNAESAVPQITKALSYSDEAARALTMIGPKGFSALTNAMNDPNAGVRDLVIRAIGKEVGGDTNAIKQLLANALKDPDISVRLDTADILRGKAPDLVIACAYSILGCERLWSVPERH
jgi:HEAT repeat protein